MNKEEQEKLVNKRWYIQSFNGTPIMLHMAGISGVIGMRRNLGYGYKNFIASYKNDFCEWYYDRDDLHRIADLFEEKIKENPEYFNELIKKSLSHKNEMIRFIEKNKQLNKLSDEELISNYLELIDLHWKLVSESHLVESYALTRDTKLKLFLTKELESKGLKNKFKDYFINLTNTIKMPFVTDYRNHLILTIQKIKSEKLSKENILNEVKTNKGLKEAFFELKKKFYWVKTSYQFSKKMDDEAFAEEIERMIKEDEELKIIHKKNFEENISKKDELIKELHLSKKLVQIIRLTDTFAWWQDDRKKYLLQGCYAIEQFLKEISKRFDHSVQDMKYLLPIDISLEKLKAYNKDFFKKRIEGFGIIYDEDFLEGYKILETEEWTNFEQELKSKEERTKVKEITGMTASLGKTIGKVKICKTTEDIEKFHKGEILVTTMTRPEFVPAMEKAAAIVTDEGGITCHAAIISRELEIPCIIGTKIATKSLVNGQLVEVNANHGVVIVRDGEE